MKFLEALVACLLLAVILVFAFQVAGIESATQVGQYTAPATIPTIFLSACGIALCIVLGQAIFKPGGEEELRPRAVLREMARPRRLSLLALSSLFVLLLYPLGFLITAPLYIFVTILLLCENRKRETPANLLITVVATGLVYAIVVHGLESHLPELRVFGG